MMTTKQIYSLIFVRRDHQVLLGHKTRGLGKGLWNGFGGKIEHGESIHECAARELKEESNLESDHLKHVGVVTYELLNKNHEEVVHIFATDKFQGAPKDSEEMSPLRWFDCKQMPYEKMWPDASSWIPMVFDLPDEKYFSVNVSYDEDKITGINKKLFENKDSFVNMFSL